MARTIRVVVTALKDTSIVTARKKLRFLPILGLNDTGLPDGQEKIYDQEHGLTLAQDQIVELDLKDDQLGWFREAEARGDIECAGLPPLPAAPSAPPSAPPQKTKAA